MSTPETSPPGPDAGPAQGPTTRAWVLLGALSLLLFLITASTFSSLGVVLPAMIKDLGWSYADAFLGFTFLGALCGASSWLPALTIRKIGVRATILIGSALMAAGFLCLGAAHGLPVYFLGTSLCGVAYQMMALIPGTHLLAILFRKRGLPFGLYFTVGSLGGVAGPFMVLAAMYATGGDWRPYWRVQAAVSVAVGVACTALVGDRRWLERIAKATDAVLAQEIKALSGVSRVHRTSVDWTVGEAVSTPQFWVLLAAYFSHLLAGVTVASLSVAHLGELGAGAVLAAAMLSFESLMQTLARLGGGLLGDRIDPRWLLVGAQAMLAVGLVALSVARTVPLMMLYALGTGTGFGLTALATTMLLLNYYGRGRNLEIFSLVCLVGAPAALGPFIGGFMRDRLGSFAPTFDLFAAAIGLVFVAALLMRPPRRPAGAATADMSAADLVRDVA